MLRQRSYGAKALTALGALYLHATVGVHAFVTAQIRELSVSFETNLALERFHRRVDMCVLLEAGRCSKRFATLGTSVTSCADVMCSDVSL